MPKEDPGRRYRLVTAATILTIGAVPAAAGTVGVTADLLAPAEGQAFIVTDTVTLRSSHMVVGANLAAGDFIDMAASLWDMPETPGTEWAEVHRLNRLDMWTGPTGSPEDLSRRGTSACLSSVL